MVLRFARSLHGGCAVGHARCAACSDLAQCFRYLFCTGAVSLVRIARGFRRRALCALRPVLAFYCPENGLAATLLWAIELSFTRLSIAVRRFPWPWRP